MLFGALLRRIYSWAGAISPASLQGERLESPRRAVGIAEETKQSSGIEFYTKNQSFKIVFVYLKPQSLLSGGFSGMTTFLWESRSTKRVADLG